MSNFMKINKHEIANGSGIRVSIFLSGCDYHCSGCFNPETHDFNAGQPFTDNVMEELMKACKPNYIKGLSILGGEPLHLKNIETTARICTEFKSRFPDKDIWCWTGNILEHIHQFMVNCIQYDMLHAKEFSTVLNLIDVLVDGQFEEDKKDLTLKWRGSSNQRVIDLKETYKQGEIVLYGE